MTRCKPARALALRAAMALLLTLLGAPGAPAADDGAEKKDWKGFGQALRNGDFGVQLRYRFEDASDDAFDASGRASTLRTALFYESGLFHGLDLRLEFQNVTDVGLANDHANLGAGDSNNGVTDRPAIADPPVTTVYQAWAGYHGLPDTDFKLGRQAIALGDQRFVGPVAWRQNYQSFDAFRVDQRSIPLTRLTAAWLGQVNTTNGGQTNMGTLLVEAEVAPCSAGSITPYYYLVDFDELAASGLSTATLGVRINGTWNPGGAWSFPYHLELANQTDAGDNPAEVDADYGRIIVTAKRKTWWVRAGYEMLGGSADEGRFTTPLATLHAHNGWADKFLLTPANGLTDLNFAVGGTWEFLDGQIVYHDFGSDAQSLDYGTELDAQLRYTSGWKQIFALEYAKYDADEFSTDTDKLWFWTSYEF